MYTYRYTIYIYIYIYQYVQVNTQKDIIINTMYRGMYNIYIGQRFYFYAAPPVHVYVYICTHVCLNVCVYTDV